MADIIVVPSNVIPYRIDIDITREHEIETVFTKQYDTETRYIIATIYRDGELYPVLPTDNIHFACTKPDGFGVLNLCGIDLNGSIVYAITEQTTAMYGVFNAEFKIYDSNGGLKSTPNFRMNVSKSALQNETIISTSEVNVLTQLIIDANEALSNMGDIENSEAERVANEIERKADELERKSSEITRNTNEENRELSAERHEEKEQIRETNELERQAEEVIRKSDEIERQENELERQAAEELRPDYIYLTQAEYDALPESEKLDKGIFYEITDNDGEIPTELIYLIQDCKDATDDAIQASESANSSAEDANEAVELINDTIVNINQSIVDANDATIRANNAAELVENLTIDIIDDVVVSFEESETDADIESLDTVTTLFGKLLKNIKTLRNGLASKLGLDKIANSDLVTEEGFVWDARRGKAIRDDVTTINNNLGKYLNAKMMTFTEKPTDMLVGEFSISCVGVHQASESTYAPVNRTPCWYNVITFGIGNPNRTTQIASQAYIGQNGTLDDNKVYIRSQHDDNVSPWTLINNDLAPIDISSLLTFNTTVSSVSQKSCYISGKQVILHFGVTLASAITASTVIGNIATYRPISTARFCASAYAEATNTSAALGQIYTNGDIVLQGAGTGNIYISAEVTFFINS